MTSPLIDRSKAGAGGLVAVEDAESCLLREGFTVGEWTVEPRRLRLVGDDVERRLDRRQLSVLVALAATPGEVVTRDELIAGVWKDTYVSENSLSQSISRLRRALGDDRSAPRFIETVSKSGYRLVAAVGRVSGTFPISGTSPISGESAEQLLPTSSEDAGKAGTVRAWRWGLACAAGVLVLVVGLGVVLADRTPAPPQHPPQPGQPRPELTVPGNQFEPRLSPRGDYVAFAWRGEPAKDDWDIWVQPIGGDRPVRMTEHSDYERLPTWSPDGQRVAFARFSGQEPECGIYARHLVGGDEERLGDCLQGMRSLDWSPDGRWLAHDAFASEGNPPRALYLLDLETGERRQLTEPPAGIAGDVGARFSPDGRSLAFEREVGPYRHDVAVLELENLEVRVLTSDAWGQVRGVDWTSDGRAVVFSSNRNGQFALWRSPVEGGELARVPVVDTWVTQPSISREGGRLIYRTFRDSVDVWELRLDETGRPKGKAPQRRVPSSRSERQPAWSPQGDAVAFISDRSGTVELWSGELPAGELRSGRPDGGDLVRHTSFRGPQPNAPSWSPDGKAIVFDVAPEGHSDLWIVERGSRRPVRLTEHSAEERNPAFSRDGEWILFTSNRDSRWNIWRMPASGGAAQQVTVAGGFRALESPGGGRLYFARLDEPGIWSVPLEGGQEQKVLEDLDLSDWGSWDVAEHGIFYLRRNPTSIWFAPFVGTPPSQVYEPPKQLPYLEPVVSFAPDRASLLFAQIEQGDDEVMTVDLDGI